MKSSGLPTAMFQTVKPSLQVGHVALFAAFDREQPFLLEVCGELTKRVCQHCYRYPSLRNFQKGRLTIDFLDGILSSATGPGVLVSFWNQ